MERVGRAGASLVGVVGLACLVGWYAGVAELTSVVSGFASMKPNTGLAFVALSVAVVCFDRRLLAVTLSAIVAALGLATLVEYAVGVRLGIDLLLPGVDLGGEPPRMAVASAASLFLLGTALVAKALGRRKAMRGLAMVAFGVGEVAVLGYAYQVSRLYSLGGYTGMALHTSVCIVLMSVSILLLDPSSGLVGLLRDRGSAGKMVRPLAPFLLLGPPVLGWLSLLAQDQGWIDTRFGAGLLGMSMTILGGALSWGAAVRLGELDRQRDHAWAAMDETNRSLEATVTERTRELAEQHRQLVEAQRIGQLGSFTHDFQTGAWEFSDQLCDLWGVGPGGLVPGVTQSLILDEDRESTWAAWDQASRLGGQHSYDYRINRASDGSERIIRSSIEVELGPDGQPTHGRGTHLDITELTLAERAAQRANAFFEAVLTATPDYTFVTDLATGAIVYGSPAKDILGITDEEIEGLGPAGMAALIHPDDQPRLRAINAAAIDLEDGHVLQLRYRGRHADGQWRWLSRRVTPFRRDSSGAVVEVLGVVRDITEWMDAEERLTHAALHDSLTGLPNRALLIDRLDAALARSSRDHREVAVLFCDLDGFKHVNDTAGHAAGDDLLREIAHRLTTVLRDGDTVARVGGDEFVIVIEPWNRPITRDSASGSRPSADKDRALAIRIAERVSVAVRRPVTINGVEHLVTASIGITHAQLAPGGRAEAVTTEQVLQDADAAMYLAKGRGKDRFVVFEPASEDDRSRHHVSAAGSPAPAR